MLHIDTPGDSGLERLIKVQGFRALPGQAGYREVAAATSTAMIGQDVVLGLILGLDSGSGLGGRGDRRGLGRPRANPGTD
jgi:hypothetical protein